MAVKTKVIDTSSTNPTEFLASGAGKPVETAPAMTGEQAAPPTAPASEPEQPATAPVSEEPAPNRPGLETPPVPQPDTDPFVLIKTWQGPTTKRALRGLNVNGGVVLRLSTAVANGQLVESMAFVPDCQVIDGQIVCQEQ